MQSDGRESAPSYPPGVSFHGMNAGICDPFSDHLRPLGALRNPPHPLRMKARRARPLRSHWMVALSLDEGAEGAEGAKGVSDRPTRHRSASFL